MSPSSPSVFGTQRLPCFFNVNNECIKCSHDVCHMALVQEGLKTRVIAGCQRGDRASK